MKLIQNLESGIYEPARERVWTPHRHRDKTLGQVGPNLFYGGADVRKVLHLHFDGSDGDTALTDSSPYAHSVTGNANCKLSTAQAKFGSTSLKLSKKDSGGIFLATSSIFGRGNNQPWTFECFIYHVANVSSSGEPLLWRWTVGADYDNLGCVSSGPKFAYDNASFGAQEPSPVTYTSNTWHHVALTYDGTTVTRWKDGVSDFTFVGARPNSTTGSIFIGGFTGGTPGADDATEIYVDELRFVIGAALYTTAFTPSAVPFA